MGTAKIRGLHFQIVPLTRMHHKTITRINNPMTKFITSELLEHRRKAAERAREYRRWYGAMQRCHNPKNKKYAVYGGRGITVCERWHKFDNWFADIGVPPHPDLQIDRIDNERGYEPGNVRWATRAEQFANRRRAGKAAGSVNKKAGRNSLVRVFNDAGEQIPIRVAAEELGMDRKYLARRLGFIRRRAGAGTMDFTMAEVRRRFIGS